MDFGLAGTAPGSFAVLTGLELYLTLPGLCDPLVSPPPVPGAPLTRAPFTPEPEPELGGGMGSFLPPVSLSVAVRFFAGSCGTFL